MNSKGNRTGSLQYTQTVTYNTNQSNILDKDNLDTWRRYLFWKYKVPKSGRMIKNNPHKATERRTGRIVPQCKDMFLSTSILFQIGFWIYWRQYLLTSSFPEETHIESWRLIWFSWIICLLVWGFLFFPTMQSKAKESNGENIISVAPEQITYNIQNWHWNISRKHFWEQI